MRVMFLCVVLSLMGLAPASQPATAPATQPDDRYFAIHVVDAETGRGVPMIELTTTSHVRCITDSAGYIAFDEPGLMDGKEVWFTIAGHGYDVAPDGFNNRGIRLHPMPGGDATIKVHRVNIAERLYRVTGQGIYADSVRLGLPTPIRQPVLDGRVMGQDSVQTVVYKGKLRWFWGDTGRPNYPLGNFHTSGATSLLPQDGGLSPDVGVDLTYFVDDAGFSRPLAPLIEEGVVWIDALMVLPDDTGTDRLVCHFARLRSLGERLEQGLMAYNDATDTFERLKTFDKDATNVPGGHPIRVTRDDGRWFYFAVPYPSLRVRADWKGVLDPDAYEAFTPLKPDSPAEGDGVELARDAAGKVLWTWRRNAKPMTPTQIQQLIASGKMTREDCPFRLSDASNGSAILLHSSSIAWNEYRKRWVMIGLQVGGSSSLLGEVWYAEAERIEGPWDKAVKIVTHDGYSFYNPRHHPMLDQKGGRFIYFEGTYASTFSRTQTPTPRYDYNQMMYRLDLADDRLRTGKGK